MAAGTGLGWFWRMQFLKTRVNYHLTSRLGFQLKSHLRTQPSLIWTRIPHLAQTSDAVNRQLSCFSSRYMNLLAVFQI